MDSSIPLRQCNKCKVFFPETKDFLVTGSKSHNGFRPLCKECRRMTRKDRKSSPVPLGMKRCSCCKNIYPKSAEHFTARKKRGDGFSEYCKDCRKKQYEAKLGSFDLIERPNVMCCSGCDKEYAFTEKFFFRNGRNKYGLFTLCKKCHIKRGSEHRKSHPEESAARARRWSQHNAKRVRINQKRWRLENKERHLENERRQRLANPEHFKANKHRYLQTEKGRLQNRAYSRVRKMRKKNIGGSYNAQDIQRQYARQKGKCYYCHNKLTKYHVDHTVPITRDGSSNDPWNLVIACAFCNQSKGNKLPHEWPQGGRLF